MRTDHNILNHAKLCKHLIILECSSHSQLDDILRPHALDLLSVKGDGSLRRLVQADEQIENRSFSRTVGADNRYNFPLIDVECGVIHRNQAAKVNCQILYIQQWHTQTPFDLASRTARSRASVSSTILSFSSIVPFCIL